MTYLHLDEWIVSFGSRTFIITDNGPQIDRKFFQYIPNQLELNHPTTTSCHPQTIRQAEKFYKSIVTGFRQFVATPQRNWHIFVQLFTQTYNTQVHCSTNTTSYSLVQSRHPPGSLLLTANIKGAGRSEDATCVRTADTSNTLPQAIHAKLRIEIATIIPENDGHARKTRKKVQTGLWQKITKEPFVKANNLCLRR